MTKLKPTRWRNVGLLSMLVLLGCARGPSHESIRTHATCDAIVVLGHRPARDDHGVEPETRARVERGVALFKEAPTPRIVFTGGPTSDGPSEAEVMAEVAVELGVPERAIRRETQSLDTIENARFTVDLLQRELGRAPNIVLVTSDYHIDRAARLFRCAGAQVEAAPVSLDALSRFQRFARRTREVGVRVAYWFFDECARVRKAKPRSQSMSSKSS